jgi:hypothetical protein
MALINFNANEVAPTASLEPVPAGRYVAAIVDSTAKPTRNGTGEYLELAFEILEGPYKGRRVWERLTLQHVNEATVRIARGNLSAICRAVGVMAPTDSSELHDLPLSITVALRKREDNGEMANSIKGFARREPTASAPRSAPAGAAGVVAGGAAGVVRPWKR